MDNPTLAVKMHEQELLQHVYQANAGLPDSVLIGPGDDMALLDLPEGGRLLAAVDQLVGGTHFDPQAAPEALVGRKSITRCLSDVAAMAGRPVAALVAVTLPASYDARRARDLFDAMRTTAEHYQCPLVGGDIAVHKDQDGPLVCSVTEPRR